ncbi:MAG: rhomboid family intramembrane serine protease [Planctomycetota bacterium]
MNAWRDTSGAGYGISFPSPTPVVKVLLIGLTGIFLVQWLLGLSAPEARFALEDWLGLNHAMWFHGPVWLPLWQLVTTALLHGDFGHLFFNAISLYFFGTMVEGVVGSRRFAWFFGLGVVVASVTSVVLMQLVDPLAVSIGASGGIFAAIAAAATFRPHATVILLFVPIPLWLLAVGLALFNLFPAIESLFGRGGGGVDHFAHLGGALYGFLAVKRGFIWADLGEGVRRLKREHEARSAANDEQELDRLLERVSRDGIASLSDRERAFLKRMSERKSQGGSGHR